MTSPLAWMRRRRERAAEARTRPAFLVAALVVGAAAAGVVVTTANRAEVGHETTAAAVDPGGDASARISLPPRKRWFGFSGGFFQWTGSHPRLDHGLSAERTVADAAAAGANSARIPVSWWDLEPRPGQLNRDYVREIDRFVTALERRGGRVLLFLGTPPPWASARPGDAGAPPRKDPRVVAAFARYAGFVARRWPRAVAIETWNEPNGIYAWSPRPDAGHYTRLHRAAAAAIEEAAPGMDVLVGGLAATVGDTRFVDSGRYLRAMYAAGLRRSDYDGLAVHPYPVQGVVGQLHRGPFAEAFQEFRRGYAGRDPRARIWVTETGATTSGRDALSPAQQAKQVLLLVRKLLTMPRIAGVYLHTQYDFMSVPPSSPERGFGLLRSRADKRGRPKPAFCALRALVRRPPPFAGCRRQARR